MSSHTHYAKITMESGNDGDTEPHQEIIVNQRFESSLDLIDFQQNITRGFVEMMIGYGDQAVVAKKGGGKPERGPER